MPAGRAHALLDTALTTGRPAVVPLNLNEQALRTQSGLSPLLTGFVRPSRRVAARPTAGLTSRLTGRTDAEQHQLLVDMVRDHAASVLGHAGTDAIDPDRGLLDLGFDSLTAVELRNRLGTTTGLRLPTTVVFDHPTVTALAERLRHELLGTTAAPVTTVPRAVPADEPIAIVSMACRYPGDATTPERFWHNIVTATDTISDFPTGRGWDLTNLYHPDPDHPGTTYTHHGGFLHDADKFDADFFGISPREATAIDPQQRLLLETAWEAVERAGINPVSLRGSATGVFAGLSSQDYFGNLRESSGSTEGYIATGGLGSVVSGRVAYTLGLEGPAITVDTACSSSLVAIHLAMQALRNGECTLALAGGVTVLATPTVFLDFARQRGLARDGRCKSFAASADGAGFAEGAGLVMVHRSSTASRRW
jgi:acyl carrier protein